MVQQGQSTQRKEEKYEKWLHTFACRSVNSYSISSHDTFFERGIMGLSYCALQTNWNVFDGCQSSNELGYWLKIRIYNRFLAHLWHIQMTLLKIDIPWHSTLSKSRHPKLLRGISWKWGSPHSAKHHPIFKKKWWMMLKHHVQKLTKFHEDPKMYANLKANLTPEKLRRWAELFCCFECHASLNACLSCSWGFGEGKIWRNFGWSRWCSG